MSQTGHSHSLKVFPYKRLINCKGENSNLPYRNLAYMILTSLVIRHPVPLIGCPKKSTCHFCGTFAQMYQTNHEKTSDKPKLGNILQNNWLLFSKVSRSWKTKRLRKRHRLEETKEMWQLNVMWDLETEKRTLVGKVQIRSIDWFILFHGLDKCTMVVKDVNIWGSWVKGTKDYFCNFFLVNLKLFQNKK